MGRMDDELFMSIIDQLAEHEVSLVQPFLMNDPLMDKQLVPRLSYMKRKLRGPRINITTNGALLGPKVAREFARLDLDSIHISSNGITQSVNKATMGIDNPTVLRNVNVLADELRKSGARTELIVTGLLLHATRAEVFIARDYWRSRGITYFINPLNDRAGNIAHDKFEAQLPFDREVNRSQLLSYDMSGCPSLYSFMGILYNGDLVTCCMDWRRSLILGNARKNSLYDLWRSRAYRHIRQSSDTGRLGERLLCKQCGQNRFSIDQDVLQDHIDRQMEGTGQQDHLRVAKLLRETYEQDQQSVKLNLVRPV